MIKLFIFTMLPFLVLFNNGQNSVSEISNQVLAGNTGTLEKMIVANGSVAMDLNFATLNSGESRLRASKPAAMRFDIENNSFFTVLVFNNELRGPMPSSMPIISKTSAELPGKLSSAYRQLMIETLPWGGQYEMVVRDAKTGFLFFNIEGQEYHYNPNGKVFSILNGRLLVSEEFATELGDASKAGTIVGQISISSNMQAIEVSQIADGEATSSVLPAGTGTGTEVGTVPGPDVVVGDLTGLAQFGTSSGTQVGLAVGTDSCNFGTVDLNWNALPSNDHPVIPQNLYRMSGGPNNDERFEQIGQSTMKHGFTALTNNLCNLGCNGVGGPQLGSGCSDPYSAGLNAGPSLGSRAWVNPFTGSYPRGDSATPPNAHAGHTHTGPSHRILTEISDLNTSLNAGASYYAESQYITPHEYAWCQTNPTQCNMNNNVSFRRYTVTGTASPFSFSPFAVTQRTKTAVSAWTGSSGVQINPAPGVDGIGTVAYKVTNPSPGVWHYEYVIYNQNIDRAIQSLSIPLGAGVTISNIGFKAPPQHPGWTGDGTVGSTGFSSTAWTQTQTAASMTWSSETFAQNPNANAIRWGTLYNFRFDSNRPPQNANATIGFFKTGSPITAQVQVPSAPAVSVTVSGRVTTSAGRGVANARVTLTDPNGASRMILTSPFGYYRFTNVLTSGSMYTAAVASKKYTFTTRQISVLDNLTDTNFVAAP
jgi:Carboxypeptidase regulatory-like domain